MNIVKFRHSWIWSPYSIVTERRVIDILYLYIAHSLSITNVSVCCTIAFKYYPSCRLILKFNVTVRHEKTGNFSSRTHARATHARTHTHTQTNKQTNAPKHTATQTPLNTNSYIHTPLNTYTNVQPHAHALKHTHNHTQTLLNTQPLTHAPKHTSRCTRTTTYTCPIKHTADAYPPVVLLNHYNIDYSQLTDLSSNLRDEHNCRGWRKVTAEPENVLLRSYFNRPSAASEVRKLLSCEIRRRVVWVVWGAPAAWRKRQHVPLNCLCLSTNMHRVTF
jgi:hypothetical protein